MNLIYSKNNWMHVDVSIYFEEKKFQHFELRRKGKRGMAVIYLNDKKMLVLGFDSFKTMMTIGIEQMNLDMED